MKYVYVITNEMNGKRYVGSTDRPTWRFREHMKALRYNRHRIEDFQNDYNRYGESAFSYFVIGQIKGNDGEYQVMRLLKTYDREHGYNYKDQAMKPERRMGASK